MQAQRQARQPDRLAELLATAARVVPGLDGSLAPDAPGMLPWCDARPEDIAPLYQHLAASFPEAGAHYWALRCWGLHIWQPIYLAVIGTHLCQCSPGLSLVSQRVECGAIRGFRIAPHAPTPGSEASGMAVCAAQLAAGCASLLSRWSEIGPLPAKSARRLLADCVLGALLAVRRQRADWSHAWTQTIGGQWLDALGLAGESGYLAYQDRAGSACLALSRKVCCLHYRRRDGDMCDTCPRLRVQERQARLAAASEF